LPSVDPDWRDRWPALVELGVAIFCVPEERGGFGLQVEAAVATARELGSALHGSPYAGLTASTAAMARADDPATTDLLEGILTGERLSTFGVLDPASNVARFVDGAAEAVALVLLDAGSDRLLLFSDRSDWSVEPRHSSFDVTRSCGDITVEPVAGRPLDNGQLAYDIFRLLLAADAIGGADQMVQRTVGYAGQRIAFGKPIGAFQAVQHRLVDHAVRLRGMELLVSDAARQIATGASGASRAVALAELSVSSTAGAILSDLVHLTGAIGFTWEYGLHYFVRRAHHDARLAGNPRTAERLVARIEGWAP
jgi:alkylation response protein AidB-like acyl-CoA dehydrogenase